MKKFYLFSIIALFAIAFTPAKAQTETLTPEQQKELFSKLMPAIFDQVKMLTGIDVLGMSQAPKQMEDVLQTHPLFTLGTGGMLRAGSGMTITPSEILIDTNGLGLGATISGLVGDIKLKLSSYIPTEVILYGKSTTINIPGKITATGGGLAALLGDILVLEIKTKAKTGYLPFSEFSIDITKVHSVLSDIKDMPIDLKPGNVFKLIETKEAADKYAYSVDAGQMILDLIPSDSDLNIGDYNVLLDLTAVNSTKEVKVSAIEKTESDPKVLGDIVLQMKSTDFAFPTMADADYVYLNVYGDSENAGSSMIDLTGNTDPKTVKAKHFVKGLDEDTWTPVYETTVEMSTAFDLYSIEQSEVWGVMYAIFQLGYDATATALTVTEKRKPAGGSESVMNKVEAVPNADGSKTTITLSENNTVNSKIAATFARKTNDMTIEVYTVDGGTDTKVATVKGKFERERGDFFYPVTFSIPEEGVTITKDSDQAKEGGAYSFTATLDEDNIHNGLELKVNGKATAFTQIDAAKGTYSYTAENVQGDLSFEITMYNNYKVAVEAPEEGLTVAVDPADEWLREGSALTLTVTLDADRLSDNVALKLNGEDVDFLLVEPAKGVYTYSIPKIQADLAFEVIRTINHIATLEVPEEGVSVLMDPENGIVEEGTDLTIVVQLLEDVNDYAVKMTVNGELVELTPDKDHDTLFSYTVKAVSGNLSIVVTLEKLSGIGSIDTNKVKFFTLDNMLTVQSTEATEVSIYTLSGSMKYQCVVNGSEQFDLPAGLYILKAGDKAEKIVVTK